MSAAEKIPAISSPSEDESLIHEEIDGVMMMATRPKGPHTHFASRLQGLLDSRFGGPAGEGDGPGGWWIYDEPELYLPPGRKVVPDLAGWRIERLPYGYEGESCPIAPDWICEVLSASTRTWDRETKMPLYAKHRIGHLWMADPIERLVEVYAIGRRGWEQIGVYGGASGKIRAEPFEAIEFDLNRLWPPSRT